MSNKIEWSHRWNKAINSRTGGSANGETYDGGQVSLSRFGEFACRLGDQGELLATFPDKGVMCGYSDEKKLVFVCIDVVSLSDTLRSQDMSQMANKGQDIKATAEDLKAKGQVLFLTVFPTIGRVAVEMRGAAGLVCESAVNDIDWSKGYEGVINYKGTKLPYYAMQRGDEMVVAVGEQLGTSRTLIPVSVSNEVDYMTELERESAQRHWDLADKIILNW